MKNLSYCLLFLFFSLCNAQDYTITFQVDVTSENIREVGLLGNVSPLSNKKAYPLSDGDGDGVYEATIQFNTSKKNVRFKFVNGEEMELQGSDDRILWFKPQHIKEKYTFNEYQFYSKGHIEKLNYSSQQIKEDVKVLGEVIQYIHPNIYRYRDSVLLGQDLLEFESKLLKNPNIVNVYKEVSKFMALVKCSHAFTNPWNQGPDIKRALFYQPDKVPFTFTRIGKHLFLDKNASESPALKKGMQLLKINNISTEDVMSKLSKYVTSDGNNDTKKLQRLLVTGEEKFALFDIFYPLEYGSHKSFKLLLQDPVSKETSEVTVAAMSKTKRTKILLERYGQLNVNFEDGWKFSVVDDTIGLLSINSFAVQEKDFDWEGFLERSFKELKTKTVPNLIIDIRGNEGGQEDVAKYILGKIVQKPLAVPAMNASVRYEVIPEDLKQYIATWDKFPYNFKGKYVKKENGRYHLKPKYTLKAQTFKPYKDGFRGKVFLITDASNSSATHLMASYASLIDGVTLVGEETGGNVQGLNAGYIFFLRLPNSRVEVDVPVMSMQVPLPGIGDRDGGIQPDMPISKEPIDFLTGEDTVLKKLIKAIKNNN